jgi:hypothetical protein
MTAPSREKFLARIKGENLGSPLPELQSAPEAQDAKAGAPSAAENVPAQALDQSSTGQSALASKLEKLTSKGLDKADQILDLPIDPDSGTFGATLRAQTAVFGHTLTAQVRVDEGKMRAQKPDVLARILELIAEEEKKIPGYQDGGVNGP